jgi:hypothetical protein
MQTVGENELKETLVGAECNKRFGVLILSRPVINGVVVNWEDFEVIPPLWFVDFRLPKMTL